MRLSRRAWLGLAGGGGVAAALGGCQLLGIRSAQALTEPVPVAVRAEPLDPFGEGGRIGALRWRAGVALSCPLRAFGGFSGLWRAPDGGSLVAVSDNAAWLTARVVRGAGGLAGLADVRLAPILGIRGEPLAAGRSYDTESLAIVDGVAYVGIERTHEVLRFDWAGAGVLARGVPVPVPREARRLPGNAGFEAVAASPLDGALVAIAERSQRGDDAPTLGLVLTGPRRGAFEVARSDGFDVTDLAFLPSGEALLLERRFSVFAGFDMRLRRIAPGAFRPGARVDGPVIARLDGHPVDNMEGLAVHAEAGRTILTLISDDNFSFLQRTLLLEFELTGESA